MDQNYMDSLVPVMNKLKKEGYVTDFSFKGGELYSPVTKQYFSPDRLKIHNTYRFEGESNPADASILFSIETDTGEKGLMTDGYGTSANKDLQEFLDMIKNP